MNVQIIVELIIIIAGERKQPIFAVNLVPHHKGP